MEPKRGSVGNILEAAWGFGSDREEREAYLEYLRRSGASEEYIKFVEDFWEARDAARGEAEGLWDRFVDWLAKIFGKDRGRSG